VEIKRELKMHKMVIVVRGDLKLSKGKACAQTGHAVLECWLRSDDEKTKKAWHDEGGKKVVLKAGSEAVLYELNESAKRAGLVTAMIKDAGHTEIAPGTLTCLGIGPDKEDKIDKVTGGLQPL
jgi:peptidyl-tRNA hydrolase, PTH2 family